MNKLEKYLYKATIDNKEFIEQFNIEVKGNELIIKIPLDNDIWMVPWCGNMSVKCAEAIIFWPETGNGLIFAKEENIEEGKLYKEVGFTLPN